MSTENPNYYAIIPSSVRYSKISPNAKLLYGELTALSNREGYCWASNSYFAGLYGVDPHTITTWVKELIGKDFITIEVVKEQGNKRKITISELSTPIRKKMDRYPRKDGEGIHDFVREPKVFERRANTTINNTSNSKGNFSVDNSGKKNPPVASNETRSRVRRELAEKGIVRPHTS